MFQHTSSHKHSTLPPFRAEITTVSNDEVKSPFYIFTSTEPGLSVMFLGKVHENEPAFTQAAQVMVHALAHQKTMTGIDNIPEANRLSILSNT